MRVLLDECLPRRLKQTISGHTVSTVQENGWFGKKNGELLRLMQDSVDVFITADQNLQYQQYLATITFGIIVLVARDNRLPTLLPLIPQIEATLKTITSGQLVELNQQP